MKVLSLLGICVCLSPAIVHAAGADGAKNVETKVPLVFTGGYETNPADHGRPVALIAAALKVPEEVFRETFTHVTPARGKEPEPEQVRKNKEALMRGLGPYGVTDERLNEVSNYYRYNRGRGQMWKTTPAAGFATVRNGVITGITITEAGSGYSSPPKVSIKGMANGELKATLSFGTDLAKNGSVTQVAVAAPATRPAEPNRR
jgi:hypothetical protein